MKKGIGQFELLGQALQSRDFICDLISRIIYDPGQVRAGWNTGEGHGRAVNSLEQVDAVDVSIAC